MGRPPSHGGPSFRFNPNEVAEMEAMLQAHNTAMPAREALDALAVKFSTSAERSGKFVVQAKQVWNWFQNRRYAIRAKAGKAPGKYSAPPVPQNDPATARIIPQAPQPIVPPASVRAVPQAPQPLPAPSVQNAGSIASDNTQMEFEAKSARDGAWYDVASFLSHRSVETGDPEVLIRFAGFGAEEDEWVNVRRHVRQRSLPCESSECVAVLPGDLILCFQEGKEQALYFDAHVFDAQRRRHDVRGCRCRFLVRYDHDQSEEIVPLRKVCRRPETDYRLQQLNTGSVKQQKIGSDPSIANSLKVYPPAESKQKPLSAPTTKPAEPTQAQIAAESTVKPGSSVAPIQQQKTSDEVLTGNASTVHPPPETTNEHLADAMQKPPAEREHNTVVETTEQPAAETTHKHLAEATQKPPAETEHETVVETTEQPAAETTDKHLTEATQEPSAKKEHKTLVETTEQPATETTIKPPAESTPEPAEPPEMQPKAEEHVDAEATMASSGDHVNAALLSGSKSLPTNIIDTVGVTNMNEHVHAGTPMASSGDHVNADLLSESESLPPSIIDTVSAANSNANSTQGNAEVMSIAPTSDATTESDQNMQQVNAEVMSITPTSDATTESGQNMQQVNAEVMSIAPTSDATTESDQNMQQ